MLWIFSQHFSYLWNAHVGWQHVLHAVLCCPAGERERGGGLGKSEGVKRERCSYEPQTHLLFMTHRKSFSLSSRWYPGSKHNGAAVRTQVSLTSPWKWNRAWISRSCYFCLSGWFDFLQILLFVSGFCSVVLFLCFIPVLTLLFLLPFLLFSSTEVHQNSHRPDRSVRGCGIICVPGHWQPQASRLLEQEGQEGQLPAYRGGCHNAQWWALTWANIYFSD